MRALKIFIFCLVILSVFSFVNLKAQEEKIEKEVIIKHHQPNDFPCPPIPDLTEFQKSKMKEMHLNVMKETLPLKNEIGEKEARLRTLMTSENPSLNDINSLLDEIGLLHTKIRKIELKSQLEIREILTDEQRLMMDSMPPPPPKKEK